MLRVRKNVIGAIGLFWPQVGHADRACNQVSKLKPFGVAFFIGNDDFKWVMLLTEIIAIADLAKSKLQRPVLAFPSCFTDDAEWPFMLPLCA